MKVTLFPHPRSTFFRKYLFIYGCDGSWLWHTGALVLACGLSCSAGCGISVSLTKDWTLVRWLGRWFLNTFVRSNSNMVPRAPCLSTWWVLDTCYVICISRFGPSLKPQEARTRKSIDGTRCALFAKGWAVAYRDLLWIQLCLHSNTWCLAWERKKIPYSGVSEGGPASFLYLWLLYCPSLGSTHKAGKRTWTWSQRVLVSRLRCVTLGQLLTLLWACFWDRVVVTTKWDDFYREH